MTSGQVESQTCPFCGVHKYGNTNHFIQGQEMLSKVVKTW